MVNRVSLGMLLVMCDGDGHLVLLPMRAPEVVSLRNDAQRRGTLLAIASAPTGGATLIVVDVGALGSLRQAELMAGLDKPQAVLEALATAANFLLTAPAAESLPPAFAGLEQVVIHVLLPTACGMGRHDESVTTEGNVALH